MDAQRAGRVAARMPGLAQPAEVLPAGLIGTLAGQPGLLDPPVTGVPVQSELRCGFRGATKPAKQIEEGIFLVRRGFLLPELHPCSPCPPITGHLVQTELAGHRRDSPATVQSLEKQILIELAVRPVRTRSFR
jgi:hypothetical protein